jgi:hypothetical protein
MKEVHHHRRRRRHHHHHHHHFPSRFMPTACSGSEFNF